MNKEEIERLRPQEGQTADEFYKLRVDNQPSKLQQDEKQEEPKPAAKKEEAKPVEEPKPAAKKTTARKTAPAKKTTARSTKK